MLIRVTLPALLFASPVLAQEEAPSREPLRTRIYVGPQVSPATPGAKDLSFGPFFDVSRARGDDPFDFEAPDESFGFVVADAGGIEFGPALGFKGKRKAADIGVPLHEVGFSFEIGGFAQTYPAPNLRVRAEARKAVSGHDGLVGELSADIIARDGDNWLFSIGPRVTLADATYHRAWYGITPADSAASGLAQFRPDGGVEGLGIAAGYLRQLGKRVGISAYARYDHLVGDAGRSPYVRAAGSRSQPSVGLALSYTFGGE
ncbi:MipA/OmpV family protein [Sphingomonas sp. J315]|uniref:MipA/OmpV family protein n=1 Tax=Sphingomonas sp. J315 TaxID=2898433 RepID=UPI0021AD860A|nr:MipA/OmpV family protein [Sphingomonas sp. J315]UUX99953.1 MipA/OmpV family protein [Sphingomonas sp. J315]